MGGYCWVCLCLVVWVFLGFFFFFFLGGGGEGVVEFIVTGVLRGCFCVYKNNPLFQMFFGFFGEWWWRGADCWFVFVCL